MAGEAAGGGGGVGAELGEVHKGLGLLAPTLNTMHLQLEQVHKRLREMSAEVARKADREGERGTEAIRLQLEDMKDALNQKANFAEMHQCDSKLQTLHGVILKKAEASKALELEVQIQQLAKPVALQVGQLEQLEMQVHALSECIHRKLDSSLCEQLRLELQNVKEALAFKAEVQSVEQLNDELLRIGSSLTQKADRIAIEQGNMERQAFSNAMLLNQDSNEIIDLKQRLQLLSDRLASKADLADLEVVRRQSQGTGGMALNEIQQFSACIIERAEAAKISQCEGRLQSQSLETRLQPQSLGPGTGGRQPSDPRPMRWHTEVAAQHPGLQADSGPRVSEGLPSPGLSSLQSLRNSRRSTGALRSSSVGAVGNNRLPNWSPKLA